MSLYSKYFLLKKIFILFIILDIPLIITEYKNEISLIIDATKGKEIINQNYYNNISKILVNDNEKNLNEYQNFLNINENIIVIKFINKLNSCEEMFFGLNNIIYIDL